MRKVILAMSVLVGPATSPAFAGEAQIEVRAGLMNYQDNQGNGGSTGPTIGIGAGYDFSILKGAFAGVHAAADGGLSGCIPNNGAFGFDHPGTICYGVGAVHVRAGLKLGSRNKLYALAGAAYSSRFGYGDGGESNIDAVYGAGFQAKIIGGAYGKIEYRRNTRNFDFPFNPQGGSGPFNHIVVGLGMAF